MLALPPGEAAGIRSGSALAKAPTVTIWVIAQVSERMPTAAGRVQLTTEPSGSTARAGLSVPALSSRLLSRVNST